MSKGNLSVKGIPSKTLTSVPPLTPWVRNKAWLTMPAISSSDNKFAGLFQVYPNSPYLALNAAGNYTVDWGDGTATENISSGVQANHLYDFAAAGLANTNAPVTFQDSGDTVTRASHGYVNGDQVSLFNIVSTTGITEGGTYFVINKTTDTFQISLTLGGSAIVLTTDGTGTLLPYKQAIVTVVPNGGSFTTINLQVKNSTTGLPAYAQGFGDIIIAGPSLSTITIGSASPTVLPYTLEQVEIKSSAITSYTDLFQNCRGLRNMVAINSSGTVTSASGMFASCYKLQTVPYFTTSSLTGAAGFNAMFQNCYSLVSVPPLNTSAGTLFSSMFNGCNSLTSVPAFNLSAGTTFTNMFNGCTVLTSVPAFNLSAGTTFTTMFSACTALITVPAFNLPTSGSVDYTGMFSGCNSLTTVPMFNLSAGTTFTNMFQSCRSLTSVPLFNLSAGTDFTNMFNGCTVLTSVPAFNLSAGTTFTNMFNGCTVLTSVPAFNLPTSGSVDYTGMFSGCTGLPSVPAFNISRGLASGNMFLNCYSLSRAPITGLKVGTTFTSTKMSVASLEEVFTNTTAGSGAITITSSFGAGQAPLVVTAATAATTTGSNVVTIANTVGITSGMYFVAGTGCPLITAKAVTFEANPTNTVTMTAHGMSNGDPVSFASIATTTGIVINTIYYVINQAANTFQVATSVGGGAITLTGNGTGTMKWSAKIVTVNANANVILDRFASSTATSAKTFRNMAVWPAYLHGMTVTG